MNAPSRRRWLVALGVLLAFFVYLRSAQSPSHRDLPLAYTDHATLRMDQRGISSAEVEVTVRRGQWRPGKEGGRFESVRDVREPRTGLTRRLRVVFVLEQERLLVITVMRDG